MVSLSSWKVKNHLEQFQENLMFERLVSWESSAGIEIERFTDSCLFDHLNMKSLTKTWILSYHIISSRCIFIFHRSSILIHPPKDSAHLWVVIPPAQVNLTSPSSTAFPPKVTHLMPGTFDSHRGGDNLLHPPGATRKTTYKKKMASQNQRNSIVSRGSCSFVSPNFGPKEDCKSNLKWLSCLDGSVYCNWMIFWCHMKSASPRGRPNRITPSTDF